MVKLDFQIFNERITYMKKKNRPPQWLAAGLVAIAFLLATGTVIAGEKESAVVVKVGEKVITEESLQQEMKALAPNYRIRDITGLEEKDRAHYRRLVLDRLIERTILLDAAKDMRLNVPAKEVQQKISEIRTRFPDRNAFNLALLKQNVTLKDLEGKVGEALLIRKVIDNVTATTPTVSDAEIKKYYKEHPDRFKQPEEVRASHILVKVERNAPKAERKKARKEIEALHKEILKVADFAQLARENSDCPSGKLADGDLGWFRRGKMAPAFEKAAFALKVGEVSDIVETRFGYHIIKVTDKHEARTVPLSEVKDKIKKELTEQARMKQFMEWLKNRKARTNITYTNPADKQP